MSDKLDLIDARTDRIEQKLDLMIQTCTAERLCMAQKTVNHEGRISALEKTRARHWILLVTLLGALLSGICLVAAERFWPQKVAAQAQEK